MGLRHDLRAVRAVALKDIQSSLTERSFTIVSIILPINFLLLFLLFAITGGLAPIAVVMEDRGPYAEQFLSALENAHSFIVQQTTASEARQLVSEGRIVAIVTIPAGFDSDVRAGRPVQLPVVINNLDVDFTNDIRRAVPLAITDFYAHAFPDRVVVHAQEIDVQPHDTGYIPYLAVSIVVVGLMVGGLLQAGTNTAREYEMATIKELLLSPASRWAIEVGKALGALIVNAVATVLVLAVIVVGLGVWPLHWLELIGFSLLLMVTFVGLGALVGTLVRRRQAVIPLSLGLSLPIFFVSGPFGPAVWGTPVGRFLAEISPVYYAIAVFQQAFHGFRTTPTSLATNILILVAFAVAAIILSAVALQRRGADAS